MDFRRFGGSVPALAIWLAATAAGAQDNSITLRSDDGFTQIRGELVDFDGTVYTVRTALGTLRIEAAQVECEGEACPSDPLFDAEFAIHGANTIGAELMPGLIQGYADSLNAELVREVGAQDSSVFRIVAEDGREMAEIELASRGSASSFDALAGEEAAIGMSSRRARDEDAETLAAAGYEDPRDTAREHVIALDGLVVVVHPRNPLRTIGQEDLAAVFSGEITNWSELGGPDRPINVYARDESGTFDTFDTLILDPAGLELTDAAKRFASNAELSDAVASDEGGIGFTDIATIRATKPLALRQSCGLLSEPTIFAMKTEEYPLSRRLYLYETEASKPLHAQNLIDFALSPEAQPLIAEAGFIDTLPASATLDRMGGRIIYSLTSDDGFSLSAMREMLEELQDAERLSTTFRFTPASSDLDPLSQREAEALAQSLAAGAYGGKQVLLVGFTDAIGQFELNRELGNRRANVVLEAIEAAAPEGALDGVDIETRGYGELMPVGCNETFGGRLANRRVEVWLRDAES